MVSHLTANPARPVPRDRSKPWGSPAQDDEPTETSPVDEEPTEPPAGSRRGVRGGKRVNLDETNVGGSLLPGDFGALANPFEQAVAPSFADELPTEPPDVFAPPPEPPEPSLELTEPRFTPPPLPTELRDDREEDGELGPVEEFTISGLMPDELAAMTAAAKKAVLESRQARQRSRRDDPDPGITGVAGFGAFPAAAPDEEETVAAPADADLLRRLGRPAAPAARDYNTFGAGLQRLDQLPSVDAEPSDKDNSVGGILELLDQSGDLRLPGEAASPPPPSPPSVDDADRDRPRRVRTNRAGSRSSDASAERPGRAPTPSPARSRTSAPSSRGATPRPAPPRNKPPLQRSDGRAGARPRPTPPLPVNTASSASRAQDEEARIRAALSAVSDDEHTSWVKFDGDPAGQPASALPGTAPSSPAPVKRSQEPTLTMHLEHVGEAPATDMQRPGADETTMRRSQRSIGDEETLPSRDITNPLADEETRPVPVPSGKPPPAAEPTAKAEPADTRPAKRTPGKRPPGRRPPSKKPEKAKKAAGAPRKKAPVAIGALDDNSSDTYRDPAIAWLLSIFTVLVLGAMLIGFLILLLYLI